MCVSECGDVACEMCDYCGRLGNEVCDGVNCRRVGVTKSALCKDCEEKHGSQDSEAIIQRRMRDAQAEISQWEEFDVLVVNDRFSAALEEMQQIIDDFRQQRPHPVNKQYRHLAEQLGKR